MLIASPERKGLLVVAVATVWQAGGAVFLAESSGPESSSRIAFLAFALAGSVSWLPLPGARERDQAPAGSREAGPVGPRACLVVVTAGAFLAFYAALARVPVEAASALEVAAGLVTVLAVSARRTGVAAASLWRTLAALGVVLVCALVTGAVLGRDGHVEADPGGVAAGIGLAVTAGACGGVVVLVSSASGARGASAAQLARERFSGAAIIAAVVVLVTGAGVGVPAITWGGEGIIAALSISGPILLLQWGLMHAEPVGSELLLASLPALVHAGDSVWTQRWDPLLGGLMGLLVLTVVAAQLGPRARTVGRGGGVS